MAKVWLFKDGKNKTYGVNPPERPFEECIRLLHLDRHGPWWKEDDPPVFAHPKDDVSGPNKYVVVQAHVEEAKRVGWSPGFYLSPLSPAQAFDAFGIPRESASELPRAGL